MTLNESIAELFKHNVGRITFNRNSPTEVEINCEQQIENPDSFHKMLHASKAMNAEEALKILMPAVKSAFEIQQNVVMIPRNGN